MKKQINKNMEKEKKEAKVLGEMDAPDWFSQGWKDVVTKYRDELKSTLGDRPKDGYDMSSIKGLKVEDMFRQIKMMEAGVAYLSISEIPTHSGGEIFSVNLSSCTLAHAWYIPFSNPPIPENSDKYFIIIVL